MLTTKYCPLAIVVLLFAVSPAAFSQNVSLTDKQFLNRGAGEFVGTIQSVQITSSNQYTETGTVVVQVNQVLSGAISVPTITFPLQRSLVPSDSLSNWDLIVPFGTSLTTAVGKELLVFVTQNNGVYSTYPAINSVQVVGQGLLVGTIVSIRRHGEDSDGDRDHSVEVEIQVSETVYGWVNGTTVTLRFSKHLLTKSDEADRGSGPALVGSMPDFSGAVHNPASTVTADILDQDYCNANCEKPFIVAFVNGRITGLKVANESFLQTLQTLDAE